MSREEEGNLAKVKRAYVALERGMDVQDFLVDFSDDCELHEAPSLPYGGMWRGKEGIARGVGTVFGTFDDFQFQVLGFLAGGDHVAAHLMLSGTGRKTGKHFSMPLLELWRFRDGKVVELRLFYFDSGRVADCFGS